MLTHTNMSRLTPLLALLGGCALTRRRARNTVPKARSRIDAQMSSLTTSPSKALVRHPVGCSTSTSTRSPRLAKPALRAATTGTASNDHRTSWGLCPVQRTSTSIPGKSSTSTVREWPPAVGRRPAPRMGCRGRFTSMPFGVLILAAAVACNPAGLPMRAGNIPRSRYVIVVANEWTDVLAVAVLPQGPKVSLNPGERRTLYLSGGASVRYRIAVSRGRHTYLSGIFIPSRAQPCALLRIDYHPRYIVPTGPVPCSWTREGARDAAGNPSGGAQTSICPASSGNARDSAGASYLCRCR